MRSTRACLLLALLPSSHGLSNSRACLLLALLPCSHGLSNSLSQKLANGKSLAAGLKANLAEHAAELAASAELGFARAAAPVQDLPPTMSHKISRDALGMGQSCPFDSDDLVYATTTPLFSADECKAVRDEAAEQIASGLSSTFTMTDTNRDVALHDLPNTLSWLNSGAFARVTSLAAECFPSAVGDATQLWVYRGLCIHYDATAGLTHQPIHRDGSLLSCVVPLSRRDEYEGGGTYLEPLDASIALDQGCALLHPSSVRHAGHRITNGDRWVMVLFMNHVTMRYGEHGRRFRARAQEIFADLQQLKAEDEVVAEVLAEEEVLVAAEEEGEEEEGEEEDEEDEELQCLLHALEVTNDSDHEVWYDLGARAHEHGDAAEALRLYERAEGINPHDALLLGNMGVAQLELGRPRLALRSYRRALKVDQHNINARFNAGELLLELGRFRGLRSLLQEAPEDAMKDEGLQWLEEELRAVET